MIQRNDATKGMGGVEWSDGKDGEEDTTIRMVGDVVEFLELLNGYA
jgi:hypothetical protein